MRYLIILAFAIGLSSCSNKENETKLSDGKYIKATVISTADANEMGMIEFHSEEHARSFVALFDGAEFPNNTLEQKVYAIITAKGKIPLARNITTSKPEREKMFMGEVTTTINYHNSTSHKVEGGGFHTKMHYRGGITGSSTSAGYTLDLYNSENKPVTSSPLQISEVIKLQLESYGPGIIYTTIDGMAITAVDTCHRHGNRVITCRSDE